MPCCAKREALVTTEDGFGGLVMAGNYSPDLIITDLSMPGMDGYEMIRRLLQSREISVPMLVVVTALSQVDIDKNSGSLAGIPIYSKPISFGVLKHLIERSLQRAAA